MGQCKPQRTDNLFLLYAQNPEIRQVKTFEKWKEEGKVVKTGSKGYNFIVGQEYEKDGVIQQGYSIQKAYDISQIRTKQPEEAEPKPMDQLMEALLTDSEVRIQIADHRFIGNCNNRRHRIFGDRRNIQTLSRSTASRAA